MSAEDVAVRFDQHVNTVRGHLEYLAANGLALRDRAPGAGRGRPSWQYLANPGRPEPDPRVREYGALAGALADHIIRTSELPTADAYAAGLEWGRQEATERGLGLVSTAEARRTVVTILDDLGFAPIANSGQTTVLLTRCPLLDVARRYPEVVCQVHRGLVGGALRELGGNPAEVDLQPFSDPDACRLHLRTGSTGGTPRLP